MAIQTFKDLLVWQKARDFSVDVYRAFRETRDFSFKDQIQRASISISNNIAEGYAKRSDKAFRNYLFIAKGSAAEVESMLSVAFKLGYIDSEEQTELTDKVHEIYKLINGFIKKL